MRRSVRLDPQTEVGEFIGQLVDLFEDFLEKRGVILMNEEREQDFYAAIIYGSDYRELYANIEETLRNWELVGKRKEADTDAGIHSGTVG